MPTWPSETLVPVYACSPPGLLDPVLRFSSDQGYEIRRSQWSRSRRTYQLVYWGNSHELTIILDFIERELRGGAASFDWSYPYPSAIFSINAGTPQVLSTQWAHGLQTGDSVIVTNTNSHNGTYQVGRIHHTAVQLLGTSGGSSEGTGGKVTQFFPYMSLQLDGDSLQPPELSHGYGVFANNDGLARLTLTLREEFS